MTSSLFFFFAWFGINNSLGRIFILFHLFYTEIIFNIEKREKDIENTHILFYKDKKGKGKQREIVNRKRIKIPNLSNF